MDTSEIIRIWKQESSRHPMFGEGIPKESVDKMWESGSSAYSDERYSAIRDRIIETMVSCGYLEKDDEILDIGSGPGTFALPMSKICRSVLCVDGSEGMLDRVRKLGAANISTLRCDCFDLTPEHRKDVAFCSLCPPMNCPEGIDLMGRLGNKCAYVSSANREENLELKIWKVLGKDYTYAGYDTDHPYSYLRSKGIDAEIRYFTQHSETDMSVSDCTERMVSAVSQYREVDDTCRRIIEDTILDISEDGNVHQETDLRMGLLMWSI